MTNGIVYRILNRTAYTNTGLASGQTSEIVLARNLDLLSYRVGILVVRVHSINLASNTGAKYEVILKPEDPSSDEPDVDYVGSAVATVTLDTATTAPALLLAITSTEFPHIGRVTLKATQGASQTTHVCAISADLVLKP